MFYKQALRSALLLSAACTTAHAYQAGRIHVEVSVPRFHKPLYISDSVLMVSFFHV